MLPLFSGVANAQARDTANACPANAPDAFTDDEGNTHEANINCIAFWDITQGTTATTYSPRQGTRRDQMATFIANLIDTAAEDGGAALPSSPPDAFTDDTASVHHNNINRLAAAGVVNGTTATTYSPAALVTRAQMATFIAQAIDFVNDGNVDGDQPPATTNDHFTDDENSVHENNINRIAEQDIVVGTGGGNFTPSGIVFRDQMASFLAQAADYIAEVLGFWPAVPGASVTARPELVSAQITEVDTGGADAGTTVRFDFDEAVEDEVFGSFHVWQFDGDSFTGTALIPDTDPDSVSILFGGVTTQAEADQMSVATVDFGAVQDQTNLENPIGDAALGTTGGGTTALPAGVTDAPDLQSAVVTGVLGANQTEVVFNFDENADNVTATGYHVIANVDADPEPEDIVCTFDSGDGTQAHETTCAADFTAAQIARVYVDAGTVEETTDPDGTPEQNPLQAALATGGSATGNTELPDLEDVQFFPEATSGGTAVDQVLYDFDEPVSCNLDEAGGTASAGADDIAGCETAALFMIYYTTGAEVSADSVFLDPGDSTRIFANFGNGELSGAVGASVDEGAVEEATGAQRVNEEDEEGEAGSGAVAGSGTTAGPDLVDVRMIRETTPTGTLTAVTVVYEFDEPVDDAPAPGDDYFLIDAAGNRYTDPTCAEPATATATNRVIHCTGYLEPDGTAAELTEILDAVLGTVDDSEVEEAGAGTDVNPEGAEPVSNNNATS